MTVVTGDARDAVTRVTVVSRAAGFQITLREQPRFANGRSRRHDRHVVTTVTAFSPVPPMDAILSATKLGGEIMKAGNELGQVKAGYLADMILVDGNPVANVKLLQDASKLLMIMKDGQFHKEPQVASQAQRQIS